MPLPVYGTKAASSATRALKPLATALKECLDPKSPFQPVLMGHQNVNVSFSNGSAFVSYVDCKDAEWVKTLRLEASVDAPYPTSRGRKRHHEEIWQQREKMRAKRLPNRLLFNLRRFANGKFTNEDFLTSLYEGDPRRYVEEEMQLGVQGSYPNDFWFVARGCCGDLNLRQWHNGAWYDPEVDLINLTDSHVDQQRPAALLPWEDSSLIVLAPAGKVGPMTFVTLGKGRQPRLSLETEVHPDLHLATVLPNTLYVAWGSYEDSLDVYIDAAGRPVAKYRPLGNNRGVEVIGIFPRSNNDVTVLVNVGESKQSTVLHFDGRNWQRQTFPGPKTFQGAFIDANGVLWVTCNDNVHEEPALWYWNGHWHPAQLIRSDSTGFRGESESAQNGAETRFIVSYQRLYSSGAELDKWMEVPLIVKDDGNACRIEWVQNDGHEVWAKVTVQNHEVLLRHGGAESVDVCDIATAEEL